MNLKDLDSLLSEEPKYRLEQIKKALFCDFLDDWEKFTVLPRSLRESLEAKCSLNINAKILTDKNDKTNKALLTLSDGEKIESVLIRHQDKRNTVCVSSQVGCPLACPFCATGRSGFKRNLHYYEIVEQVLLFARSLAAEGSKVGNIVFMGMGEPFLNYDNVMAAIKIFNDPKFFNIGSRHISISTIGLVDGIKKMTKEPMQLNLAISLHAPNDKLRDKLIKINRQNPLSDLLKAVDNYLHVTNRKVMFEYLMLKDHNDGEKEAQELSRLLSRFDKKLYFVNLIAYNETARFLPSSQRNVEKFSKILWQNGIKNTIRRKFGENIQAACGQLAANKKI